MGMHNKETENLLVSASQTSFQSRTPSTYIYSTGSGEEDEAAANSPQQAQGGEKTGQSTEYEEWTLGDSKEHTPVPTKETPIGTVVCNHYGCKLLL